MKTQTIGASTEIVVNVPNDLAEQAKALIQRALDQITAEPDDRLYTVEEVMGETTPGELLKGLRAREGLTQKQFADKLKVKQHHISEMERNIRPITKQMAQRIEQAFGIGYKTFL